MSVDEAALFAVLDDALPQAIELRRQIHAAPRLSGDEQATMKLIAEFLPVGADMFPVADAGSVVRIGGTGPSVGIRAELDALPVQERTASPFASQVPGVMHACGHDVHMAALCAVSQAVASVGSAPPLLALFQPREETYPSGGHDVVLSDLLGKLECRSMVGVHVQPALPPATVACVPGAVNASSDQFSLTMTGRSGHAAYPHRASDPVIALAEVILALQSIPARSISPMDSVVLGVSMLRAGQAANTIPDRAEAIGTMRALSTGARETMHRRLTEVTTAIARAHECEATVDVTRGEPVLVNHHALTAAVAGRLQEHAIAVVDDFRSVGSDDFSYYCEVLPATMLFIGTDARASLHASTFLPSDEDVRRVAETMLHSYLAASSGEFS